jgi:hypothetical protein
MPSVRPTIRAVLGVFALLITMAWVPATALADGPGNITIVSAGPDGSGNPYDLTVVANDGNGLAISTMTAHLAQGSTDVADVTMQASDTSDPSSQTWVAASPVQAVNLPAGTYTITVDAADSSESDTGVAAGTMAVTYTSTNVSVTPSPTFVTEGSQSVTFTGTVTGTARDGSDTQVPIGGVAVSVSDGAQVNTNASGVFHYTATNITQSTSYDFTVAAAGDGSYPAGDSGSIPISVQQAATSIDVTPSQTSVSQGSEQIIFTGTVTAVPAGGGSAVPVSGATVTISGGGTGEETTASDGTFSYEAAGVTAATDFTFSVSGTSLYGSATTDVPIGTAQSTTNVIASPSQTFVTQGANDVTFTGQVTVTAPGGGATVPIGSGVPVQVSVGGVPATTVTTDANGGFSYSATGITSGTDFDFSVSQSSLYTAGSDDVPMPAEQAATAVNVIPSQSTIELGSQDVTFSGQVLMTPPGSATQVAIGAGVPVSVSGGSFSTVVTTDATGSFSVPVTGIAAATDFTFSVAQTSLYGLSSNVEHIQAAAPAQTTIGLSTPPVITFGSPTATVTGTVAAVNASNTSVPLAGVTVSVSNGDQVTTNSSGQFTYQISGISQNTNYTFSVSADSNGLYSEAQTPLQVNVTPGTTALAVTTNPAVVNAGPQTVQFTATVEVTPAGTGTSPQPIGAGVQVLVAVNGGIPAVAGTTDANGVVTDTITGVQPGDDYYFTVGPDPDGLYGPGNMDFSFGKQSTTLVVTPSRTSVTEGSQTVIFSGTITGTVMGGTPVPIADANVSLNGSSTPIATTDGTGSFSYTAKGIAAASTYVFSIAGTSTYTSGMASVAIGLSPARTRITGVTITPSKLRYGQTATLKGTVQYLGGSTWTGLGRATVHLKEGTTGLGSVTASSTGAFTARLPSTHGFAWSAMVNAAVLTQQTTRVGNLIISVPMRFSTFHASLGTNGKVSVSGCLVVTAPVKYGPTTSVQLQYKTSAKGAFHLLGRPALHNADRKAKGCTGASESYFSAAIKAASDNAYYRAVFPTSNSFQRSVSKVIHSARTQTRITSFAVSPRTLKKGQIVTMSGRLWRKVGGTWKEYAGRRVELIYNQKGTTFWSNLGSVTTNSKGFFKLTAAGGTGNFTVIIYAQYSGSKTDLAARSAGIAVAIKQESAGTVQLSPSSAKQLGAIMAASGPEATMLAVEDEVVLGIMPGTIPVL